jgi:hypothetical protein
LALSAYRLGAFLFAPAPNHQLRPPSPNSPAEPLRATRINSQLSPAARLKGQPPYVDERRGVGIRLKPAAAIVRQYGEQFRALRRKRAQQLPKPLNSL